MSSGKAVSALLCFSLLLTIRTIQSKSCLVSDIAVQDNFDLSRFSGKWYEIEWLPAYFEPVGGYWVDLIRYVTPKSNGQVDIDYLARTSLDEATCISGVEKILNVSNANPAKFTYIADYNATSTIRMNFWIISTDYDNYAFIYGCTVQNTDGTCLHANAWIVGRYQQLSSSAMDYISNLVANVCLNISTFVTTPQEKDCSTGFISSGCERSIVPNVFLRLLWSIFGISSLGLSWLEDSWIGRTSLTTD